MNKKLMAYLWIFVTALCFCVPTEADAQVKAPGMDCHAYVVMDAGSGQVLFGQDQDKVIYPASTAKLMTAIVCIEQGDVNSTIKTKYDVVHGTTLGTYCLGIGSGIKFKFKDLLHMSLMASAADATDSLAVGVFGSKQACVDAMNAKCKELGLTHTSFDNPVGSDIGAGYNNTYATATEMAKITRYAMTIPLIRSTVAKAHYQSKSGQDIYFNTTNAFLRGTASYSRNTYKIIGSKSGTTNAAGHVFIATAQDKKGHEVICAFFGDVSKESTFASIRKLLDYTFKKYKSGKINLTDSNYDVRGQADVRTIYDEYVTLGCFPKAQKGVYHPGRAIKRKEMVKLISNVCATEDNTALTAFTAGNTTSKITSLRLAKLVADMYPGVHLEKSTIDEVLEGCINTENLTEEEKEIFAVYVKCGLAADDYCKNTKQIITRKKALIFADRLADYQVQYAQDHPSLTVTVAVEGQPSSFISITRFNKKWIENFQNQASQKAAQEAVQKAAEEAAAATQEAATAEVATQEAATAVK